MVRVRARAHLDLLLLAAVGREPGDGASVLRQVWVRSGRRFTPTPRSVYPALHRLERNRLIRRDELGRYQLTESGRRSFRTKHREWESFAAGVEAVLGPGV